MKKIAFAYGDFDCLSAFHYHLVREMRKHVLPGKDVIAVVPDDYACFCISKSFPIQTLEHRKNNLAYLLGKIIVSYSADPSTIFKTLIAQAQQAGDRLIFFGYDDDKEFPGHEVLRAANIPLRFIKKPKINEVKAEEKERTQTKS